jgi:hypothetical protein
MSPGGGEIVTRWARGHAWQLVGGTNDGDPVPDAEVEGWTALVPVRPGVEGADPDGLAKLLAFSYAVPQVEGEGGWKLLTDTQRAAWRGDAEMVRGYLVNGLGWRAP